MSEYNETELKNIEIVKSLYTDVFDTGNCPVVNDYYHKGAKCHLKGKTLQVEQMKGEWLSLLKNTWRSQRRLNQSLLSVTVPMLVLIGRLR